MFLTNKTSIVAKLEDDGGTAYSDAGATLAQSDYDVRIRHDVSYSTEIAEYRRKILDGTLDHFTSVMGRQTGTASFTVDMAPSPTGSEDVAPPWGKLLEACGFKGAAQAAGYVWVPHVDITHKPLTMEIVETLEGASPDTLVTRLQGAMGNVVFMIGTVGEPIQMNFEFSGSFVSIVDRAYENRIDPDTLSVVRPGAILSACFDVNSLPQDLDTFEFNMNNDIQEWIDPCKSTGVKGFYRAGFEPQLSINPTMKQLATEPGYTEWMAATALAVDVTAASADGPDLKLSAPKAQRITHAPGDRNGARISDWGFLLTKDSGNDVFKITQGTED